MSEKVNHCILLCSRKYANGHNHSCYCSCYGCQKKYVVVSISTSANPGFAIDAMECSKQGYPHYGTMTRYITLCNALYLAIAHIFRPQNQELLMLRKQNGPLPLQSASMNFHWNCSPWFWKSWIGETSYQLERYELNPMSEFLINIQPWYVFRAFQEVSNTRSVWLGLCLPYFAATTTAPDSTLQTSH